MDPAARPLSEFVTRSGGDLFVDGQPWTFTGVNLYNANSDGWCRDALDDNTLDAVFDEAVVSHSGHGVVRAWFFQSLATSFPSGQRDWTRFDRLIRLAAIHGTKVIPTLSDQWGECGAKVPPTYAFKTEDWYTSGYKAPDPALATGYGGGWVSYRDWVAEVVARYKDDPTVAFWQLMNEAEVNPAGAFGACPPGDGPRDTLKAFASDVSSLVKGIDPEHLVSLGTIGGGQCGTSGPQYQDVYSLPDLDLCEYHDYTPNQSIPGDQWNGLGVRIQQCAALDKPLFVGELGVRPIDAGGTLLDRARTIRAKVVAQVRRGIDGVVVWDYSPSGPTLDNYDLGPYDAALEFGTNPENATAPYVVTTTDDLDDGTCDAVHCSLREAIAAAQAGGTLPIVQFAIPGSGPHVIRPTSALPTITRPLLLDGTSQTDFAGSPTVVISGVDAPAGDGLVIQNDDAAVRGLVINGFTGADIRLLGAGSSLITGNRIGTDVSGTVAVRNPSGQAAAGIVIEGSAGNQVGGVTGGDPNLIAGVDAGVLVTGSGATGNRIVGNLIGTDSAGSPGAGITGSGVRIANGASGNVVGGAGSGERNVISGATGDAVAVVDDATAGNTISGNAIDGNGGLGIDLGDDGVDPPAGISNPTTGPNRHQARPLIDDVTAGVVTGRVWGISGSIHVEFFASSACDPSGSGEGARFIGADRRHHDGPPAVRDVLVRSVPRGGSDRRDHGDGHDQRRHIRVLALLALRDRWRHPGRQRRRDPADRPRDRSDTRAHRVRDRDNRWRDIAHHVGYRAGGSRGLRTGRSADLLRYLDHGRLLGRDRRLHQLRGCCVHRSNDAPPPALRQRRSGLGRCDDLRRHVCAAGLRGRHFVVPVRPRPAQAVVHQRRVRDIQSWLERLVRRPDDRVRAPRADGDWHATGGAHLR